MFTYQHAISADLYISLCRHAYIIQCTKNNKHLRKEKQKISSKWGRGKQELGGGKLLIKQNLTEIRWHAQNKQHTWANTQLLIYLAFDT